MRTPKKNIFVAGNTYHFFLVYAKKDTEQTYKMYVGPEFDKTTGVKLIRARANFARLESEGFPTACQ